MRKKELSRILEEWSDEFHNEFMDSYSHDLRTGHYRDLLSEVIDRIDALNAYNNRKWWKKYGNKRTN